VVEKPWYRWPSYRWPWNRCKACTVTGERCGLKRVHEGYPHAIKHGKALMVFPDEAQPPS
jgi:hypothetical protein